MTVTAVCHYEWGLQKSDSTIQNTVFNCNRVVLLLLQLLFIIATVVGFTVTGEPL